MEITEYHVETKQYVKSIAGFKKIRWDIDKDVLRGRNFDFSKNFFLMEFQKWTVSVF